MPVLARDVRDRSFKTVLGGYDADGVRTALDAAAAAFERVESEIVALQQQHATTIREIERIEDLERSLLRACVAAEEDGRIRCGAARRYATRIIAAAEEQANVLLEAPTRERDRIARDLEAIQDRRRQAVDVLERLIGELQRPRDAETLREAPAQADADAQAGGSRAVATDPPRSQARHAAQVPPQAETAAPSGASTAAPFGPGPTSTLTPDPESEGATPVPANGETARGATATEGTSQTDQPSDATGAPVDGSTDPADRSRRIRVPVAAGAAAAVLLLLQGSAGVTQPDGVSATATATFGPAERPSADLAHAEQSGANVPAGEPLAIADTGGHDAPSPAAALTLRLRPLRTCWVRVVVDDRTDARELQPGEEIRLQAQRSILLRVGDAGALSVELNGRVLPPLGGHGQVVERRFTAPAATP